MFDFNPPGAFGSLAQNKNIEIFTVPNQPPTISSITGNTTINEDASGTLTGIASDSDGNISSYLWSVDDTSTITITTGDAAILRYTASQVSSDTQVTFTLTVTDDDGATASATYDVTVNNVPVPNQSPTISSITGDTTINEGASGTLTGTASDSDGTISTYAWSVDDTSVITITSGNAATLQYTASQVSSDTQVTFTLTVTDDDGATASATYDVTVNNVPVPNQSPTISSITGDTTINEGASGTLTGIASDSDGNISSYLWSVDDTSTITITTGDAAILRYTASQVSSDTQVTFTLTVTDDDGATASATYDVTVNNVPVPNQSPTISSITGDTTINEGASGTLTGIASDSDGTISTYAWSVDDTSVITITSGNAATLQYTASQVSSDTQVTFTLTVTDDDGATAFDTYDVTVTDVSVPTVTDTTPPRVAFIVDRTVEINDSTTNGPTLSNSDRFGVSVTSIGDLDGDGVTDLAVGAARDDHSKLDSGAVHIMFMNTNGTVDSTVEINDSTTNGPTLSSSDRFGISVAAIGDLDGDGVTDLAVGAYQDDNGGGSERGAVHIMFMNTDGTVDSTVEINSSTANGPTLSNSDNFGISVASIGDLDGDGVTDLAVGAYQDDNGGSDRGAVHIMFMNTDGTVDSTVEINSSTANGPTLLNYDNFGISVASIGDLDGDGVTDLAVGAYGDDNGGSDRGAVHIMFMNTDGTVDSTVEINDSTTNGPTLSNSDNFGVSVASIGDFDGDGVTDLAVGAYQDDNSGQDRGAVHIMFMNTDGTVDSTVEINDSTTNGPTLSNSDYFGVSVASIGDLDGDGVTDLAVGAYRDDNSGRDRGAINVIYLDKEVEQNKDIDPTAPTVTDTTPPRVASILRGTPLAQSTTDTTLVFAVTFDEPVTNVDDADFTVTGTGTGTISGVSGSGTSYRVTVTVDNVGTIGLDIAQNHDIQDTATNRLANLTPTGSDQTYTVTETTVTGTTVTDTTPPRVASILRGTPLAQSTTDTTLVFAVTFDEPVTNVDDADFTVTGTGTGTISGVSGSGTSYRVTVTVDNVGTIGLDIAQNHDIQDTATNRLANLTPTGSDQTYTVTETTVTGTTVTDTTPPRVASILRGTPLAQSTTDTTLVFAVTFDEPVTNVDDADFTVTGTGTGTISGVSGSGASYRVTVTVDNVGTIGLDIAQNHDIQDTATNRLANLAPTGSDQTYTVTVTDTTPPRVASILRGTPLAQSTTDTTLVFAVTFDEPVTNVDAADFTVTGSGTGTISGVSGSGASYRVTVTVTASGTIGLDIAQNHDIQDTATNGLIDLTVIGSNETYTVNQLPVLNNISPQTGDELTLLTFTAEATDPDDNDTRTYSLIEPIPDGATMDTNTGVFSWTPTEAQDGRHTITVQVSDGNGGTDSQNVTITVTEVNQNPRLDPIGAQTIDETDTLRFTATAHDVDIYQGSPNSLRFSLDGDMPRGASITREGSFSWRPDQSQDGVHSINVTVSDGNGGTASELVSVTVNDIAPRLVSVRGSGSSITLTFSEPVKINGAGLNGFTVSSSSGSTVTVESITGNGTNTLTLLLDGSLSRGDTLSYDSGTGDVADESGKPLESFVDATILLKSKKSGTAPPPSVDTLEINGQSYNVQNRVNHHPTPLEVAVDQQPISMSFTAHDRLDILYFAVYLNLQDDDISYTNSDTYVEYNRGQTNIVDPHNLFSDASITISADPDDRNKKTVALDITFADAIGNTNMVIRTWNADRQSSIVIIVDALNIIPSKVDPEPQATTEADPEPQVAEANPEPRSPAAVPDNPEPVIETFDDDSDYDRALLVLRMWSGFESEVADDGQLLDVMGLTHMGADIPAWVMTDLAPLVVKGLITLDEFRVALEYVMGNNT